MEERRGVKKKKGGIKVEEEEGIVGEENKRLDPYFVFDTGFTVNFQNYGFFTFKILNVFNEYYVHPGVGNANAGNYYYERSGGYDSSMLPQPGRSFMVNLTLTF